MLETCGQRWIRSDTGARGDRQPLPTGHSRGVRRDAEQKGGSGSEASDQELLFRKLEPIRALVAPFLRVSNLLEPVLS